MTNFSLNSKSLQKAPPLEGLGRLHSIQNRIYELRGERIMLDFDLAALYEVETRIFNQAVKRNIKRFPEDFMFRLTKKEWSDMRSQIVMTSKRPLTALPYAFTEQGVAMLSGVLNSDRAIQMNIAIMRAFVEIRKILLLQNDVTEQLKLLKDRVSGHDIQLNQIYDALENLLDEKAAERKWMKETRSVLK
ncbi:MAG: ORF6N domain-containing protein [Niabella sp.]